MANKTVAEINEEIERLKKEKVAILNEEFLNGEHEDPAVNVFIRVYNTMSNYTGKYVNTNNHDSFMYELNKMLEREAKRKTHKNIMYNTNNLLDQYIRKYNKDIPAIMESIGYQRVTGMKGTIYKENKYMTTNTSYSSTYIVGRIYYNAYSIVVNDKEYFTHGKCDTVPDSPAIKKLLEEDGEYAINEDTVDSPTKNKLYELVNTLEAMQDYVDTCKSYIRNIYLDFIHSYDMKRNYLGYMYQQYCDAVEDINIDDIDRIAEYTNNVISQVITIAIMFKVPYEDPTNLGYESEDLHNGIIKYSSNVLGKNVYFIITTMNN